MVGTGIVKLLSAHLSAGASPAPSDHGAVCVYRNSGKYRPLQAAELTLKGAGGVVKVRVTNQLQVCHCMTVFVLTVIKHLTFPS